MNLNKVEALRIIDNALQEDIGSGDITTESLIEAGQESQGIILAKQDGIVAGLEVAKLVFSRVDKGLIFESLVEEGVKIKAGEELARVKGSTKSILTGERVALNFLQRISGIATKTAEYVKVVKEQNIRLVDTRKTTPGLRIFEKYAVKVGGGSNHRFGLYDAVMIKDNHIKAAGGIIPAVKKVRSQIPHTMKIEVESENLSEVQEAILARADIIMLDNMSLEMMKEAVSLIAKQAIVEASGGITKENLLEVAKTGVDVISLGTLTHTIRSLDISLNIEEL